MANIVCGMVVNIIHATIIYIIAVASIYATMLAHHVHGDAAVAGRAHQALMPAPIRQASVPGRLLWAWVLALSASFPSLFKWLPNQPGDHPERGKEAMPRLQPGMLESGPETIVCPAVTGSKAAPFGPQLGH
jgi:hypothetical protein